MKTINESEAKKIKGNVEGGNVLGSVEYVLYTAKKAGKDNVTISRPGCPPVSVVGDEKIFGDDKYIRVDFNA